MTDATPTNKSRRRFVKVATVGGAAVGFGLYVGFFGEKNKSLQESWGEETGSWTPNAWLRIHPDGTVTVRVNHSEMGQGVTTGLPTIVAEELEVEWSRVGFEIAPVEQVYRNPQMGVQVTGGSTSTSTSWDILRHAGAVARTMLVRAAAKRWGVAASDCTALKGAVLHGASGRKLGYGDLAAEAAEGEPPKEVALKEPSAYRLIGSNNPRLDIEDKVAGKAIFGIDVHLPGLLNATVIHPPVFGDKVERFDATKARSMPGVRKVLAIDGGVAVVAETFWQAAKAAEVVQVQWERSGDGGRDSEEIWKRWQTLATGEQAKELSAQGDADEAMKRAAKVIEATYRLPYQAHATPEPMNCTAHVQEGRCRIWVPTQNQESTQESAARLTGLGYADIDVETTYLGGGFGRRSTVEYVTEAVQLSQAMAAPVKILWTREEDIAHDCYRPASYHRLKAGLDSDGRLIAWRHRIVGPDPLVPNVAAMSGSMAPYALPRGLRNVAGCAGEQLLPLVLAGAGVKNGAAPLPYSVDHVRVDWVDDDPGVPTGFWRSVADGSNAFVVESFFDEIATAAGRDALEMRRELLKGSPRRLGALDLAVDKAGWGSKLPAGVFRGLAVHEFHHAMVGMVAEISVAGDRIKVHRVVCAVDCGTVINPRNVRAQVAGGVAFGLTATLLGEVTVKKGAVEQSNFHDFPILSMAEMPRVEVHLVASGEPPLGIGEVGVPTIAPAVANALFAATGKRLRKLPFRLGS